MALTGDGRIIGEFWPLVWGFRVLGLDWDLRMVCGGAKIDEGLRRVGGAILAAVDQTLAVVVVGLSSSEGGGRSPYNPPNISTRGLTKTLEFETEIRKNGILGKISFELRSKRRSRKS